ncbi:MAG: hypothetical protein HY918_01220 [Candidatus Doudnabacteria bacterium]|nr:hypothetical protein [Candidatus Doudnabacteria bacterium]
MHQEIVDYIIQAQKHGLTETDIKQNLLNVGWEAAAVEDAFAYAKAFENKPQAVKASDSFISHDKGKGPNSSVLYPAVASHDSINISEQHFAAASGGAKKSGWKIGLLFGLLVLVALAGGAYGYYRFVYLSPERILNKYLDARTKADSLNTNYTLSYTDKGPKSETDPTPAEITFGISGNGYADNRDENNTKSDITTKLFMKAAGQEASTEIQIISLGKVFYIKLPDIAILKEILPDPSVSWIKLDLDSIEKYITEQMPAGTASSTNSLSSNLELRNKVVKIWRDAKILNPGSKAVREVIDQTPVFRLEPSVDSEKLTEAVINSINTIQSYQGSADLKLTDDQKKAIAALVEKFKVKSLKLWVGQKDYKLYKIQVQIAAPSIKDAVQLTPRTTFRRLALPEIKAAMPNE